MTADKLTNADMEEFAKVVARATVAALAEDSHNYCGLCNSVDSITKHEKSHEALDQFIATMNRIDDIKWGIAKAIAVMIVGGIAVLIWGIVRNN